MNERESGPGLGDDPAKLDRVLDEISQNYTGLTPISAAVSALISFEAAPCLKKSARWENEPPGSPLWQYFQEAKGYFFTLNKIKSQAENRQFSNPEDSPGEAYNEDSISSRIGSLRAYEDVLAVLNEIYKVLHSN